MINMTANDNVSQQWRMTNVAVMTNDHVARRINTNIDVAISNDSINGQ